MNWSGLKRIFFVLPLMLLIGMMTSCEKYVTPNKVEKKITDKSWNISTFIFQGENITNDYISDVFTFNESGTITFQGYNTPSGTWSVGLNKDPVRLYIGGFSAAPYDVFNDDWIVETVSKDKFTLASDDGLNNLTFILHED